MTEIMCRGDVLLMKTGEVGIVRNMYQSKKYNTCVVEIKGSPQQLRGEIDGDKSNRKKSINGNQCIRIKLPKTSKPQINTNKHKNTVKPNPNTDFKKLSGEQLFDKLFALHEIVNEDHIHTNKLQKLQTDHKILKNKIKAKELALHDLRDEIQQKKKYLLLQQSVWTITHPKNIDKTSTPVLLLTYPTFTNGYELFENLCVRFFNLNRDDYQQRLNEMQWEIQIKVISLLQQWIRIYWMEDFYFNADLVQGIFAFFCVFMDGF